MHSRYRKISPDEQQRGSKRASHAFKPHSISLQIQNSILNPISSAIRAGRRDAASRLRPSTHWFLCQLVVREKKNSLNQKHTFWPLWADLGPHFASHLRTASECKRSSTGNHSFSVNHVRNCAGSIRPNLAAPTLTRTPKPPPRESFPSPGRRLSPPSRPLHLLRAANGSPPWPSQPWPVRRHRTRGARPLRLLRPFGRAAHRPLALRSGAA